ncbi:MAG: diacylglycerol kinase family lipid kinase [Rhodospirillales bacterium]|nr:MAG: diacylglycerol kinase family lipid kinase [Rhodospirillales bacterium]
MSSLDGPSGRRLLIVHNPVAGRWQERRLSAALEAARGAGAVVVAVASTSLRGDARRLALGADSSRVDVVVAAGGDGTVNEVAAGLLARDDAPPALGIVPLGTVNVLAREIGLAFDAAAVGRALARGAATPIHLGEAAGVSGASAPFVLMAGAGFDARVVAGVDGALKRRLGKGAYVWRALAEMARGARARYRVEIDGVAREAASVIVSNARSYGGSYTLAPGESVRRPVLSVCLFDGGGRADIVRYGAALLMDRLARARGFNVVEAREVSIRASDGAAAPLQIDGDNAMKLPVTIRVAPRRLTLLMPDA